MADDAGERSIQAWLGKNIAPALCGVAMTFGGIIGFGVADQLKEIKTLVAGMSAKVDSLQIDMAVAKTDIGYLKSRAP